MAGFPATGGHAPPRRQRASRQAGWTADKRTLFLDMLSICLSVRRAVDAIGLSYSSAYQLKRRDPAFAQRWAEALDEGYSNLEFELLRQSIEGCERTETVRESEDGPVKQVKVIHSYPHGIALRLLQAHRDEVQAFRVAEAERMGEEDVGARVRAHMDLVRGRLEALPAPAETSGQEAESRHGE